MNPQRMTLAGYVLQAVEANEGITTVEIADRAPPAMRRVSVAAEIPRLVAYGALRYTGEGGRGNPYRVYLGDPAAIARVRRTTAKAMPGPRKPKDPIVRQGVTMADIAKKHAVDVTALPKPRSEIGEKLLGELEKLVRETPIQTHNDEVKILRDADFKPKATGLPTHNGNTEGASTRPDGIYISVVEDGRTSTWTLERLRTVVSALKESVGG